MPHNKQARVDVVVVGAGFGGLYALHHMRAMGLKVQGVEAADDVGGVWYWNRYPGARCDVESLQYSYSFSDELQQEWNWSERFATQPEILRYLQHVADRFDLRRLIKFGVQVTSAIYDEAEARWLVTLNSGEQISASYCIMATGPLSAAKPPDIPGLDEFKGTKYFTSTWPHEDVDFSGQRVGVIGTGSSGIQAIPLIAEQASQLHVFQRTPSYCVPARNAPLSRKLVDLWRSRYTELRAMARASTGGTIYVSDMDETGYNTPPASAFDVGDEERKKIFEAKWDDGGSGFMRTFEDLRRNIDANRLAGDFIKAKIRETVKDPKTAAALTSMNYPVGSKRLCVGTDYYETYNRENVRLVDLRETPIERITATGIKTSGGEYELDSIVFATGFDAMTGALNRIDIRGRDGIALADEWSAGPRTYLGLMCAGFPNLFIVGGPGSPSVLSNVVSTNEDQVDWIGECISYMREKGFASIEPRGTAQDEWVREVNEVAARTLYFQANSWYLGANVPGKPRVFMPYVGGLPQYRQTCEHVARSGYQGFEFGNVRGHLREALG